MSSGEASRQSSRSISILIILMPWTNEKTLSISRVNYEDEESIVAFSGS